ncbi:hypothetical protein F4861DRAFT_410031 [Xylaria intraflava]|nr:hypothetical protein F4861DRAFT_410031 [Xylaria intraflava]
MADIVQADDPSLAVSYSDCINSFAKFVLTLSESDCDVIRRDEVQITQIFEEYGRIKIWADQSKADLPATARGSLDDILRHDDELKSLVRDILQRLKGLLQQAMYIAERKYDPEDDMDRDSISSVSDSDYSTDDGDEPQHHRIPKIRLLVRQIADQIRSLHDISSLLRRPTVSDKFIRSKKADPKAATLQEPDRFYPDGIFGIFDYNHIFEKVLQWRGLNKSLQNVDFSIEDGAPVGNALNNQQIEDIGWLCQRLARANTKRREQLQYWKSHPYESKQSFTGIEPDSEIDLDILVRGITPVKRQKDEESRSQVSTIKPPDPHVLHEGPKSILSKQSFSTVAFSDVHDTGTNIRARTIYAPTAIGQDRAISVPGPPKMDQDTNFRCPYCGMSLGSEYSKRQLWKRHVFRDLRPYICTFQQCHSAEKLFSSRHEWKHHEFQIHRRETVYYMWRRRNLAVGMARPCRRPHGKPFTFCPAGSRK